MKRIWHSKSVLIAAAAFAAYLALLPCRPATILGGAPETSCGVPASIQSCATQAAKDTGAIPAGQRVYDASQIWMR
jgi:hypothetical protein